MAIAQLMHIFNVRKQGGFGLDKSFFKNKPLIGALILSMGLQLSAVYLPFMNELLGTSPLQVGTWGIIFLAASLSTLVVMGLKSLSVEVKNSKKTNDDVGFCLLLSIAGNYLQKQEKSYY